MAFPSISPSARAHDVSISFANSCNCCWRCCPEKKKEKEPVYINKRLEVEKFDKRKARNGDEIRKTYQRLELFVRSQILYFLTRKDPDFIQLDEEFTVFVSKVICDIEREIDISFKTDQSVMTYEKVKIFNKKLSSILSKNIEEYEIKRKVIEKLTIEEVQ